MTDWLTFSEVITLLNIKEREIFPLLKQGLQPYVSYIPREIMACPPERHEYDILKSQLKQTQLYLEDMQTFRGILKQLETEERVKFDNFGEVKLVDIWSMLSEEIPLDEREQFPFDNMTEKRLMESKACSPISAEFTASNTAWITAVAVNNLESELRREITIIIESIEKIHKDDPNHTSWRHLRGPYSGDILELHGIVFEDFLTYSPRLSLKELWPEEEIDRVMQELHKCFFHIDNIEKLIIQNNISCAGPSTRGESFALLKKSTHNENMSPDNYFRKRGGVWAVRFKGSEEVLLTGVDKGAEYINFLLGRPNKETSVYEIVCGFAIDSCDTFLNSDEIEDGFQVTQGIPLSDTGFVADRKAVEKYRETVHELFQEIEEARATNDKAEVQRIENEMRQIISAINEAEGLGGKPRKSDDKRKNIRDAFRNAVNRAISCLDKYDKPLASHLKKSIKFGSEVVYVPVEEIVWEVNPICNNFK